MFTLDLTFQTLIAFYLSPVMVGVCVCIGVFFIIAGILQKYPKSKIMVVFDMMFEMIYKFYSDILGDIASHKIKIYVTSLFFVIFTANIIGVVIDFISPIFGFGESGDFVLKNYIVMPTSEMQFNIALSLFATLLIIYIQFGSLGIKKFFYSYFPIWGSGYIEVEKGDMKKIFYYPLAFFAKIADIIISLFLGFLDIIGLFAKVISLAFRLFGNMTSGTILLGMLIVGVSSFSQSITGFIGGINLPIILPIIVYLQGILVACIQAMVFPLLVAIFIRMALVEEA